LPSLTTLWNRDALQVLASAALADVGSALASAQTEADRLTGQQGVSAQAAVAKLKSEAQTWEANLPGLLAYTPTVERNGTPEIERWWDATEAGWSKWVEWAQSLYKRARAVAQLADDAADRQWVADWAKAASPSGLFPKIEWPWWATALVVAVVLWAIGRAGSGIGAARGSK
jgi:hypothetical protein